MMMNILEAIGIGLLAGVFGTAAMTISETIEQKITKRASSTVPAQVGARLLGPNLESAADVARLNTAVHWTHGITMGAVRGLLYLTPLSALAASVLHFPIVWGGDAALYRVLHIAPPPWQWEKRSLVTDLGHKLVLSLTTSVVFLAFV